MKSSFGIVLSVLSLLSSVWGATPVAVRGVDISSLLFLEKSGITYKDFDGRVVPFENLLVQSGVTHVRQRFFVNPSDGRYNLEYNLELSRRCQCAGLKIYLDLHYSDTWADPGHQNLPAAWSKLSFANLRTAVYNYTLTVSNAYAKAGIAVESISIGNEIGNGIMWPAGEISSFKNIAQLLESGLWGVKDSSLNPKPQIMLHLQDGYKWDTVKWFFDSLFAQNIVKLSDIDIFGFSYYPFYGSGATLAALKSSLTNVASRYGKSIIVAETDWPASCPNAPAFPPDTTSVPFSVTGQIQWMQTIMRTIASVPKVLGLIYWEPGWIGNGGLGGPCADNLFVEQSGKIRTSLTSFMYLTV